MFTREHLRLLDIKNIYFKTFGGITTLIQIVNMNENTTTIITSDEVAEKGILYIELSNESKIEMFVSSIKDFAEKNTFTLFYEDPLPEEFIFKLQKLNSIIKTSEQRKELRYEIGLDNWKQFGLKKPDIIFTEKNLNQTKCVINNVSIHGVLLTGIRSNINIGDKVFFICDFEEKQIKQLSIVINVAKCGTGYYKYSLRFLEPLSLIWCNHIIDYGDYLENLLSY